MKDIGKVIPILMTECCFQVFIKSIVEKILQHFFTKVSTAAFIAYYKTQGWILGYYFLAVIITGITTCAQDTAYTFFGTTGRPGRTQHIRMGFCCFGSEMFS